MELEPDQIIDNPKDDDEDQSYWDEIPTLLVPRTPPRSEYSSVDLCNAPVLEKEEVLVSSEDESEEKEEEEEEDDKGHLVTKPPGNVQGFVREVCVAIISAYSLSDKREKTYNAGEYYKFRWDYTDIERRSNVFLNNTITKIFPGIELKGLNMGVTQEIIHNKRLKRYEKTYFLRLPKKKFVKRFRAVKWIKIAKDLLFDSEKYKSRYTS